MTWITVILTPLSLVFDMLGSNLDDQLLWLVWVNDISWCVEIVVSFIKASPTNRTFSTIAKAYFTGFFFFDFLATVPPMITLQENRNVNLLKFFRFVHIGEMFTPFSKLLDCLMAGGASGFSVGLHGLDAVHSGRLGDRQSGGQTTSSLSPARSGSM